MNRIEEAPRARGRRPCGRCAFPTCSEPTREHKPYCPKHVEFCPHAAGVVEELERREREIERVLQSGRAPGGGHCYEEIVRFLGNGPASKESIRRYTGIPLEVVARICNRLERERKVRFLKKGRVDVVALR